MVMRLYQGLESSGSGSGGLGFDFASGAQPGGSELSRKMNRIRRSLLVVFLSFGALFVKRDVLCCGLINLPFRKKKKGKKMYCAARKSVFISGKIMFASATRLQFLEHNYSSIESCLGGI